MCSITCGGIFVSFARNEFPNFPQQFVAGFKLLLIFWCSTNGRIKTMLIHWKNLWFPLSILSSCIIQTSNSSVLRTGCFNCQNFANFLICGCGWAGGMGPSEPIWVLRFLENSATGWWFYLLLQVWFYLRCSEFNLFRLIYMFRKNLIRGLMDWIELKI